MKESYLPFHSITTLNMICESSRKIDNFRSDNLFTQCPGFVMYDSRFTTYKFFWNFFSFEPIYYIDLKFDCPFNTIVIQTLNDEFKSQKTLQQRKFTCERNCLRVLFSSTILIFEQPILFDSFDVRHENAENRPIFVPFVFRRDQHTMVSWCVDKIEQHSTILERNDKKIFFMSMEIYTKESKGTR